MVNELSNNDTDLLTDQTRKYDFTQGHLQMKLKFNPKYKITRTALTVEPSASSSSNYSKMPLDKKKKGT